jgi:hypothetical protein
MRTGGSSGKISRTQCQKTEEGDGVYWDIAKKDGKNKVKLPVKYRYRSPVIFEFHTAGKRNADAYAAIWLHHFEDNQEQNVSIPIWKTGKGMRLTQNYITEENFKNIPDIKIEGVGRLQFRGRFKAGMDESHSHFVTDNNSRETQETWDACHSEGVRDRTVSKELRPAVQQLHDQSLTQGRDVLAQADESEKKKWLSKDGTDWSGAFGQDPARYADRRRGAGNKPKAEINEDMSEDEDESSDSDSDESDLGLHDASNDHEFDGNRPANGDESGGKSNAYGETRKDLHRKNRGLMQWKPVRNLAFAKDEVKFAAKRTLKKGSLQGRQPDVETEA